jgi:hypothetical protein
MPAPDSETAVHAFADRGRSRLADKLARESWRTFLVGLNRIQCLPLAPSTDDDHAGH